MSEVTLPGPLVSTDWVASHLGAPNLVLLDASWALPTMAEDPKAAYRAAHLPGAVPFDIDEIADPDTDLPHMVPTPERYAEKVGALGIGDDSLVVAYDWQGIWLAAVRAWWLLRLFGHRQVAVMDGGLPKWRAEGRALSDAPSTPVPAACTPRLNASRVADLAAVRRAIAEGGPQLVDARDGARFRGEAPELRPGVRSGHMPGATNLFFMDLIDPASQTLKPPEEIAALEQAAGIDPARPIISSCGSGVTACVLALAHARDGKPDVVVYDGSWTEYGGDPDSEVVTG